MPRTRLQRVDGVVLRRFNFSEADRILVLFTRERGKIRVIAKGVRKPTSRLAGHLELFSRGEVLLAQGRELDIVSQVQILDPHAGLRTDLDRTAQAFVIAELIDAGTPDAQTQPDLYVTLLDSLGAIEKHARPDLAALHAQIHLLSRFGFKPELQRCVHCRTELQPVENVMHPERGGAMCPTCAATEPGGHVIHVDTLKLLRILQRSGAPGSASLNVAPGLVQRASVEMRALSERALERTFRTPPFVVRVRELSTPPYTA
ncbi:MAG: DNA repair protein RecO [Chloroflexota bacterium]